MDEVEQSGRARYEVWRTDAFAWLARMEPESVDLVITDPPYASLDKHRAVGTTTRLQSAWFPTIGDERLPELMHGLYRVLRRDTHCYTFCDAVTMFALKPAGEAAGFHFWKPLVWDKEAMGMGYHYRARHEFILFFEKGKRKLRDLGVPDVLRQRRVRGGYPTEKPVGLLRTLVSQSSEHRELVLDPFCGSGSTGVAALQLGRRFLGSDTSQTAVDLAFPRLEAELRWECDLRAGRGSLV